jgi:hypothetical protein
MAELRRKHRGYLSASSEFLDVADQDLSWPIGQTVT